LASACSLQLLRSPKAARLRRERSGFWEEPTSNPARNAQGNGHAFEYIFKKEHVLMSFAGVAPDDGFSAYFGVSTSPGRVGRWGDYSWATSDESGNFWIGAEVIPPKSPLETFVPFANWGTFITSLTP
jgi:hypothetical protein